MDKLKQRFQLLSLLTIFFVYRAILGVVENNMADFTLWILISIVYIVSLIIAFIIFRNRQRQSLQY